MLDRPCSYDKCTGCKACFWICPSSAIKFVEDKDGFHIPKIDGDLCSECKLCIENCPAFIHPNFIDECYNKYPFAYAAKLKDHTRLARSASGGVFAGLAVAFLQTFNDAFVFGASYDSEMRVRHIGINNTSEVSMLQSSKYVESDVLDTYLQVKLLIDKGVNVLYSGTPCQIAGLRSFIGEGQHSTLHDTLFTVDLICHGVPSPKLFKMHLNFLSAKYGGQIVSYNFRSKRKIGWGLGHSTNFVVNRRNKRDKQYNLPHATLAYNRLFSQCATYRECCYTCVYASKYSVADLTIGDFWKIQRVYPKFFDSMGVSAVLVNSKKGGLLFEMFSDKFDIWSCNFDDIAKYNKPLREPSVRPIIRNDIYLMLNNYKEDIFNMPDFNPTSLERHILWLTYWIKSLLPRFAVNWIKSLLGRVLQNNAHTL
jgi:coenzyme F420-reducing hydrogenase beta subunit